MALKWSSSQDLFEARSRLYRYSVWQERVQEIDGRGRRAVGAGGCGRAARPRRPARRGDPCLEAAIDSKNRVANPG